LWKVGDPQEKAEVIGTTADAKNSFFTYDNRYSDVSFSGESDFYANTCYIRNTGTFEKGKLIYESKKSADTLKLLAINCTSLPTIMPEL